MSRTGPLVIRFLVARMRRLGLVLVSVVGLALIAAACGSSESSTETAVDVATDADESETDPKETGEESADAAAGDASSSEDASEGDATDTDGEEMAEATDADEDADDTDDSAETAEAEPAEATGGPSADELRMIVLDGWEDIFESRWTELIPFYTEDCQSRITPEDFDLTIGEAMRSLEDFGIELADVEIDVRIDDFIEGESAGAVTIATLPGDEPSEDPPQVWVVENGQWRNPDCDDIAGVAASQLGDGDVGSSQNPAALGSLFDSGDWRGGIISVVDAVDSGLTLESNGSPAAGVTWLLVTYDAQYFGTEVGEQDPYILKAVGGSVYNTYDGDCILDADLVRAQGLSISTAALPGESFSVVNCIDVPTDEIDDLVFLFEDVFSGFAPEIAYSADGAAAPELPAREQPDFNLRDEALTFGEIHDFGNDWTVTVVAVVDGVAEGLISEWADEPPTDSTYPVVIYEATYNGPELTVNDSFSVDLIGESIHDTFQSACFLDDEAAEAAYGVSSSFEFTTGETYRKAQCATAPTGSVGDLVVLVEHYELYEDDTVLFAP